MDVFVGNVLPCQDGLERSVNDLGSEICRLPLTNVPLLVLLNQVSANAVSPALAPAHRRHRSELKGEAWLLLGARAVRPLRLGEMDVNGGARLFWGVPSF